MSQNPPRIAVTYAVNSPSVPATYSASLKELADNTERSLLELDAQVRMLDTVSPVLNPREVIDGHDGLLVLGGADLDPGLYGQRPENDSVTGVNREADLYELSLISAAQEAGTPVLGICRGMQLINVAAGGTLIQDLPRPHQHRLADDSAPNRYTDHVVSLVPGTLLAGIYPGRSDLMIRSSHHQAADLIGEGLIINAQSSDGVVEGVERTAPWVLGVQWHPEESRAEKEQFAQLLQAFLQVCVPG